MVLSTGRFYPPAGGRARMPPKQLRVRQPSRQGGWKDHTAALAMRPVESDGGKARETFLALGIRETQMNENN